MRFEEFLTGQADVAVRVQRTGQKKADAPENKAVREVEDKADERPESPRRPGYQGRRKK